MIQPVASLTSWWFKWQSTELLGLQTSC